MLAYVTANLLGNVAILCNKFVWGSQVFVHPVDYCDLLLDSPSGLSGPPDERAWLRYHSSKQIYALEFLLSTKN
jgi:hypothetical protein